MAQPAAVLSILVSANTAQASRGLTKVDSQLRGSEARAKKFGAAMQTAAAGAGLAAVAAAGAAVKMTVEFDKSMRNVNSIAQLPEKQFKNLEKSVLKLAGPTAQAPNTLAKGLYDLVSSGFDAKESMIILEKSARAATAGLTTTEISTKAVAAVLNAYRKPATDAGRVSDLLFQTVNRGVISFEQLSQSIGDVLPFAASLGVGLNQVGAAIATMTKAGISPEETMTRIKNIMVSLLKPSVDAKKAFKELGVESGEQLIKQKGFQGALEALISTTDGSKKAVAALFPNIRSLGGALALTGKNAKGANADLAAFKNTSGATNKALSQQSTSVAYQWQQLKASVSAVAIKIGTAVIPILNKVVKGLVFLDDMNRRVWRAMGHLATSVWTAPKKALGDFFAATLRGFAKIFDAASHIPGVGGKFKNLAESIRRSATRVDELGENINKLPSKKQIKIDVDLLMKDFAAGNIPKLQPLNKLGKKGGPASTSQMMGAIEMGTKSRTADWVKNNKDKLVGEAISLGGASGSLAKAVQIAGRFGLAVTSGFRPGDPGLHGQNRARDFSDGVATPHELSFAKYMVGNFGKQLLELIHTPLGFGIKNGQQVPLSFWGAKTNAEHYNHVHVAMQRGGLIPGSGSGDKVPVMAEPGEGFINKRAVQAMGGSGAIAAINQMMPRFQGGGVVYDYFRRKGLSAAQAAGIVGVFGKESGYSTTIRNPKSGATGLAQWLGGRLTALQGRRNWQSLGTQLGFVWSELMGPEAAAYHALRGATTPGQAAQIFDSKYERSDAILDAVARANAAYKQFGGRSRKGGHGGITEDSAKWNWRTMGNKKRGVTLKGGKHVVVTGSKFDDLKEHGKLAKGYRHLLGDVPGPNVPVRGRSGLSLGEAITRQEGIVEAVTGGDLRNDVSSRIKLIALHQAQVRKIRARIHKINHALKGKLKPKTRARLLAERGTLRGDFNSERSTIRTLGGEVRDIGNVFEGVGADIGTGVGADTSAADAAAAALLDLTQQRIDIDRELLAQQKRNEYLITTQGAQMLIAATSLFSQGIGRSAALGRRTPAAAGRVAAL